MIRYQLLFVSSKFVFQIIQNHTHLIEFASGTVSMHKLYRQHFPTNVKKTLSFYIFQFLNNKPHSSCHYLYHDFVLELVQHLIFQTH
jgi:hypothetical protein